MYCTFIRTYREEKVIGHGTVEGKKHQSGKSRRGDG